MALNLPVGNNLVVYTGATDLALSSLSNWNSTFFSKVFAVSPNGLGYTSGTPGSAFGVTTLKAPVNGVYSYYIFVVKQATTLSSTLFGIGTRLAIPFAAGASGLAFPVPIQFDDQVGTYQVESSPGLSAISYQKNGAGISLPFGVVKGDSLIITATNSSGADSFLTLVKQ